MAQFDTFDGAAISRSEPVYTNFGPRLGAAAIDWLVMIPLTVASVYFTALSPNFMGYALVAILALLYGPLMDATFGGTLGKKALKQRVVTEDGSGITIAQGFLRATPWLVGGLVAIYANYQIFQIPGMADTEGWMEYSVLVAEYQSQNGSFLSAMLPQLAWVLPLASTLFLLGNARKQAAHDILADTFVVTVDPAGV